MTHTAWGWFALSGLILLSALTAAAETALSRSRRHELRERGEAGNRKARAAYVLAEDSSHRLLVFEIAEFIFISLIAALFAFLVIPPLSEWLVDMTGLPYEVAAVLVFIVMILFAAISLYILTSLLPSVMVWRESEDAAISLVGIARLNMIVLSPISAVTSALRKSLIDPAAELSDSAMVTEEEIKTLVDAGEEEGSIEEEEKEMIYSIFQLDETLVREIMVPRIDVVAIEMDASVDRALDVIIEAGHSRLPVYDGSLDQIVGLLYAKDLLELLRIRDREVSLAEILRPAFFVPETKKAMDLLSELQTRKVHLAIVIDEYGGTAGIVTIEDIVEEIVGEIFDEYDEVEEALFTQDITGDYTFSARIDLDDFNRIMDTELSDELGDTLGGYIYGKMGRIPSEGDRLFADNLEFRVMVVNNRRIKIVNVRKMTGEGDREDIGDDNIERG